MYGLTDAARQFYGSIEEVLLKLGMTQSQVDPTLYYLEEQGHVVGTLFTHTDDFMHCRDDSFNEKVMDT